MLSSHCEQADSFVGWRVEPPTFMRIILIIFLSVTFCNAQTIYKNWVFEDGKLIFSKVFEVQTDSLTTATNIVSYLKTVGSIKDTQVAQSVTCDLMEHVYDLNDFTSSLWFGRVVIDVKDKKYRVRIYNLRHRVKAYTFNGSLEQDATIDEVLLKKNRPEIRPNAIENADNLSRNLTNYSS